MQLPFYLYSISVVLACHALAAQCPTGQALCGVSTIPAPPVNVRCDVAGRVQDAAILRETCTSASFEECRDACLNKVDCKSFSYIASNGACALYSDRTIDQNFHPSARAPRRFYDKKCFNNPTCLQSPSGTAFCSSYLGIPVSTKTTTSLVTPEAVTTTTTSTSSAETTTTTTTVTDRDTTTSVTSTATEQDTTTITETTIRFTASQLGCQSTATVISAYPDPRASNVPRMYVGRDHLLRRQPQVPVSTPACVTKVKATALSSACSCLPIETSTTTTTATSTLTTDTITMTSMTTVTPEATETTTTTIIMTSSTTITTTLERITTTSTVSLVQPTPTSYTGLNYYVYANNYDYGGPPGNGNGNFDARTWDHNRNFQYSGTLRQLSDIISYDYPSAYYGVFCQYPGQSYYSYSECSQITVVLQGFLFAPVAGTYTLVAPDNIDNELSVWTGDNAYGGYTNGNRDFRSIRSPDENAGGSADYELEAGEFLPITLIYVNGGGPGRLTFGIRTPDGTYHSDTTGFFTLSCDESPFVP